MSCRHSSAESYRFNIPFQTRGATDIPISIGSLLPQPGQRLLGYKSLAVGCTIVTLRKPSPAWI